LQHLHQCVPDLARCGQRSHVIPICPDSPVAAERAMDRLRDANGEALDAAAEDDVAFCFAGASGRDRVER
jgi:hypothetical protein